MIDDQMASNNWVVSGNLTESGQPLLAGDPHLGAAIPAVWSLQHLQYEVDEDTKYMVGATMPGMPFVLMGRTQNAAWAITAALTDVSDLYSEEV